MIDQERDALRTAVYGRLERERTRRWEELQGCTVTHMLFGVGTISKVMMPDWSNPIHLAVQFDQRERIFHLSTLGDRTKFPEHRFPDQLAGIIAHAEQEIDAAQRRLEEDRQRMEGEARAVVARRKAVEAERLAEQRQAEAAEESARRAHVESRLSDIREKVDHDQPLTDEEVRLLLQNQRHQLLLAYCERLYATTHEYRALVKAATAWSAARHPEYAIRVTELLLDRIDRLPESVRAAVFTLRGEAFFDLRALIEARDAAQRAITYARTRPQPYQLLGAILMACGETTTAEQHFAQARALAGSHGVGRLEKAQQAEIKKLMQSGALDPARQKACAADLLRLDPRRYHWLDAYL